jgi:hypothetical protein
MLSEALSFFILKANSKVSKVFDTSRFSLILEFFWQKLKFNTRGLSPIEKDEALKVFGTSLDFSKVRIDECSLISWIGARINKCEGMGVTTFYTINFNRKIKPAKGNSDMKWLIHELTHVAQMQHSGSKYLLEAIHAQKTTGYKYLLGEKVHLRDYNREQQASIIADYYIKCCSGNLISTYEPYIRELREGKL